MTFRYFTNCIQSTAEAINAMVDQAREITFSTFARRCDYRGVAQHLGYAVGADTGLHLKDDALARYYKSVYRGRPCYYLQHSAIEYIFIRVNPETGALS